MLLHIYLLITKQKTSTFVQQQIDGKSFSFPLYPPVIMCLYQASHPNITTPDLIALIVYIALFCHNVYTATAWLLMYLINSDKHLSYFRHFQFILSQFFVKQN